MLKADADFDFPLVEHVPVLEGYHGARGRDNEILVT